MKKVRFFLFAILTSITPNLAFGQVTLTYAGLSPYHVSVNDLLNILVTNTSSKSYNVNLHVAVYNASQQGLLDITTGYFTVSKGIKNINSQDVSIASEDFLDDDFEASLKKNNNFPPGVYTICAWIIPEEETNILAKTCIYYQRMLLSPPRLIYPFDSSTIKFPYPILIWLPPMTGDLRDNITYELQLAEMSASQSPSEALTGNSLTLDATDIPSNFYAYPIGATSLEKGKSYAWTVLAYIGGVYLSSSQIWSFTVSSDSIIPDSLKHYGSFAILRKNMNETYFIAVDGIVKFKFADEYTKGSLNYKIFDESQKDVSPKKIALQQIYGDNSYSIDLSNSKGFTNNSYYILQVTSQKKEQFYLRFQYRTPHH